MQPVGLCLGDDRSHDGLMWGFGEDLVDRSRSCALMSTGLLWGQPPLACQLRADGGAEYVHFSANWSCCLAKLVAVDGVARRLQLILLDDIIEQR